MAMDERIAAMIAENYKENPTYLSGDEFLAQVKDGVDEFTGFLIDFSKVKDIPDSFDRLKIYQCVIVNFHPQEHSPVFTDCLFSMSMFFYADLSGAMFQNCMFHGVKFVGVNPEDRDTKEENPFAHGSLHTAVFRESFIWFVEFIDMNMLGVSFDRSDLFDADFSDCYLLYFWFWDCLLDGCDFSSATLLRGKFVDSWIVGGSFADTQVKGIWIEGTTSFDKCPFVIAAKGDGEKIVIFDLGTFSAITKIGPSGKGETVVSFQNVEDEERLKKQLIDGEAEVGSIHNDGSIASEIKARENLFRILDGQPL